MAAQIEKYGMLWPAGTHPLLIEMNCIRKGWGKGLSFHYEQMRKIIWPRLDSHRWHNLCREEIVKNKVTVLMGPKSTGKTHEMAWYGLCKYFVSPADTCVLVSSTDIRSLKLRVWGEITSLWGEAVERFDFLPGHVLDSKLAITTDELDDGDFDKRTVRDMRKGIVAIPCIVGNKFLGLSKYAGIKQKHVLLIADELAMMGSSFLASFSNLDGNEDFQAVCAFNPIDPIDQGGKAAEPVDGWNAHMAPDKTSVWDTLFMRGRCINLVGTDTPNNDYPPEEQIRYKYLLNRMQIEATAQAFGRESLEFYSQCLGVMKVSQLSFRVLNRELCEKGHAFDRAVWQGGKQIGIAGLDSAWGGDRCVFTWGEFGQSVGGETVLELHAPELVPVVPVAGQDVDYSISEWVKQRCGELDIPPSNFFHDSTGRGSLGTALARVWSAQCNPVEFGGQPTNRPLPDFFTIDPKTGQRRQRLCNEYYLKFVTELWFSVRFCVESGQLRGMIEEVLHEFSSRVWRRVKDDKVEVESKSGTSERPGMKQRLGFSPDLADSACLVVEGARRRGFVIARLENAEAKAKQDTWLHDEARKYRDALKKSELVEI